MVLIVAQVLAAANRLAMVVCLGLTLAIRREEAKEEQERHRTDTAAGALWREMVERNMQKKRLLQLRP